MASKILWKPVKGYVGYYEVSNTGIIRGIKRSVPYGKGSRTITGKVIATRINNCGYVEVRLNRNGKCHTTFVHVLLAQAFLSNPLGRTQVNHKNGIKTDNRIENLECCTASENMLHAYSIGLIKAAGKPVRDVTSGKVYTSCKEAAKNCGMKYSTLTAHLRRGAFSNPILLEYAEAA